MEPISVALIGASILLAMGLACVAGLKGPVLRWILLALVAVAAALFVSPKTVEANLARAYQKLGVRSRAELGALVAQGRLDDRSVQG